MEGAESNMFSPTSQVLSVEVEIEVPIEDLVVDIVDEVDFDPTLVNKNEWTSTL